MKKPTRVVFLESREGTESLFTSGLRSGAIAAGWEAEVIFLADEAGVERPDKDVRGDLLTIRPDTICFLMDAPLHLPRLWEAPSLVGVDKVSLWFDDYYRSPKTLGQPEVWSDWQRHHGVRVGIWDAFWRDQWKRHTGGNAFPSRLAADPTLFSTEAAAWKPEWSGRAAFVGTIPALKSLEVLAAPFPRAVQRLLADTIDATWRASWPIRPYELARTCQEALGSKYRLAVEAALKAPEIQALWHHLLWRWGKRIARLRGLAAVAQGAPLALMSGHGTEIYAGEAELRDALPGADLAFSDTKGIPVALWKNLFRTGKFHVQITDPQSVAGGLPFRVFETAASAMPLLSDQRAELAELFPEDCGVTLATGETGLAEAAAQLMHTPLRELRAQGREFHKRFLAEHTWEARWLEIAAGAARANITSPLAEVNWRPVARQPAEPVRQVA